MAPGNEVGDFDGSNPCRCKLGFMEGYWKVHSRGDDLVINLIVGCLSSMLAGLFNLIILGFGELFRCLIQSFGRI